MKRLLVTVLSMEAVVVLLAIIPAKQLGHVNAATAGAVCGAIALVAILLCRFVGRGKAGLYAGSVFQALVIAAGVLVSAMYILGVIFALLWFTGIWLGRSCAIKNPTYRRVRPVSPPPRGSGTALRPHDLCCSFAPVSSSVIQEVKARKSERKEQ